MKKIIYPAAAMLITLASAFTLIGSQEWTIEDGYEIRFSSADPSGVFTDFTGDIQFNPKDLSASYFKVQIAVNSINTGNGMQNMHAVSADWFDAAKYPDIKFASKDIEETDKGYVAHGLLVMHGVEKKFDIPFKFEKKDHSGVFKSKFDINRNDFKIGVPGQKADDVMHMEISVPVSLNK